MEKDKGVEFFEELQKLCEEKGVTFGFQSMLFSVDEKDDYKIMSRSDGSMFLQQTVFLNARYNEKYLNLLKEHFEVELVEKPKIQIGNKDIICYDDESVSIDSLIMRLKESEVKKLYIFYVFDYFQYCEYSRNILNINVSVPAQFSLFIKVCPEF